MKQRPRTPKISSNDDAEAQSDLVDCFLTGQKILRSQARLVRLGPGAKVWLPKDCCRPG
jgi:hypothetical protein